jgi:glycosyltransferase involved in cell wall biosynthesis
MKILWISSLAWLNKDKYRLPVNGPGAVSGSLFQQNIIEGLEAQGINIEIINDYPTSSRINRGFSWSHNGVSDNKTVSTVNIPLFSLLLKTILILSNLFFRKKKNEYNVAIVYLIHTPYLVSLWFTKKLNKNVKTVLICPDLPGYMDMSLKDKPIKNCLKRIDNWLINKLIKNIDAFILFSDAMRERLPINNKDSIVIEGVYSPNGLDLNKRPKKYAIMHAGTLHKNIGIENLIEGFKQINDPKLELWLFGDGELNEYIQKESKIDTRIRFFGFVSRTDLFEYQKQAFLLINARNHTDEYTKYSFPSKTYEYMVSGTPFLTTKLQGIPEEYYNFVYKMDNNDPTVIASNIIKILSISEEENNIFGERAREFILKNKNKNYQSNKVKNFLESIR